MAEKVTLHLVCPSCNKPFRTMDVNNVETHNIQTTCQNPKCRANIAFEIMGGKVYPRIR